MSLRLNKLTAAIFVCFSFLLSCNDGGSKNPPKEEVEAYLMEGPGFYDTWIDSEEEFDSQYRGSRYRHHRRHYRRHHHHHHHRRY